MYLSDIVAPRKDKSAFKIECSIFAQCDEKGNSGLADQLMKLKPSERAGFLKVFEKAAVLGPKNIPRNMRHEIDKSRNIYEFIKGDYRIPYFYDGGNLVVCSHVFRKKGRKTPTSQVNRVVRLREEYLAAKASGRLKEIEQESQT